MKSKTIKYLMVFGILLIGLSACSKEIKKDNTAEHNATIKAATKSVEELNKQ